MGHKQINSYLDRLRRSGKQISASLRTGMIEDPAIIQSKMLPPRPSSSKAGFQTDCLTYSIYSTTKNTALCRINYASV